MPTKKTSGAKKRTRPAAKKGAGRKPATPATAPAADRLRDVARSIGSTVGELVVKTKRALHREPGTET